jgi:septum formation protein
MLILASSSPRRRALLGTLELPFIVVPSGVHEREPFPGEDPAAYALVLAGEKAADVALHHPRDVVIAADTVVAVGGHILGKPLDAEDALRMLQLLRGREHAVTTAVVVRVGEAVRTGAVTSRVRMRSFSLDEAKAYVATGEPMDKAGGYAVQERGGALVENVEGCYNAVVGFPLCLVVRLLQEVGVQVALPLGSECREGRVDTAPAT